MYIQCTFSPYLTRKDLVLEERSFTLQIFLSYRKVYNNPRKSRGPRLYIHTYIYIDISLFVVQRHRLLSLISLITPPSSFFSYN